MYYRELFYGKTLVGIHPKLVKEGEKDIDLVVHSFYRGRPSPCVVIENYGIENVIGGNIDNLEQMFQQQVSMYPGFIVKERSDITVEVPE